MSGERQFAMENIICVIVSSTKCPSPKVQRGGLGITNNLTSVSLSLAQVGKIQSSTTLGCISLSLSLFHTHQSQALASRSWIQMESPIYLEPIIKLSSPERTVSSLIGSCHLVISTFPLITRLTLHSALFRWSHVLRFLQNDVEKTIARMNDSVEQPSNHVFDQTNIRLWCT